MPESNVVQVDEFVDLAAFEEHFDKLPDKHTRMWISGGAGDHHAIRFSREAFGHLEFVPGTAIAKETVELETTVLGASVSCPILIGPSSGHGTVHPEGAMATYRGASLERVVMGLSIFNRPYAEVAGAANGPLWFQVFPEHVHNNLDTAKAAIAAGSPGLIVTVDSSFQPRDDVLIRESLLPEPDLKESLKAPLRELRDWLFEPENSYRLRYRSAWATWSWMAALREKLGVPIVVKGVLDAEDARLAIAAGANAIIVSNHGGRVLDYAVPPLEVLPEIVDAVGDRITVMLDSGIRSGLDVFRALALGADAVLIGRPALWGLHAGGEAGVRRVVQILREELRNVMAQAGCATAAEIARDHVRWAR